MPNDAKLGLVVGVGLVIAVAVVFFRKDLTAQSPADKATAVAPSAPGRPIPPRGQPRQVRAKAMSRGGEEARRHTVQEGDTLAALAQRYYGDSGKSAAIQSVNGAVLNGDGPLTPGTVLTIPDLEEEGEQGNEP